ncbi:MAG: hypothetical protein N0E59_02185 [Candidatus Thiodiazotropha taylori]|nr:hypothetical protein [Candidatus Thiodiazotropha taylori]MCG8051915.1 hypothetical protein [Candidatus Thiodiazotropha taylori]MCG8108687.1 hypothetical protein [Candidatus Thiodiazotropha taylori]MCG8109551.1 hypothetical protein [Candidatus Thiodiazotropha taylori]MCW4281023.1 hypothetical protein [Candidatus Thiodiazotropha taylori]
MSSMTPTQLKANRLVTEEFIANNFYDHLTERLHFANNINRQYEADFNDSQMKHGDEIFIRLPAQYNVRYGQTIKPQETLENYDSIVLGKQFGVDMTFSSREIRLDVNVLSDYFKDAAILMASKLEAILFNTLVPKVYNHIVVKLDSEAGDFGRESGDQWMDALRSVGLLMDSKLVPAQNRKILVNDLDRARMVDYLKDGFEDSGSLKRQWATGQMGRFMGFDHFTSLNIPFKRGLGNVSRFDAIDSTLVGRVSSLTTQKGVASNLSGQGRYSELYQPGDLFQIADVYQLHDETKHEIRDYNQGFVVSSVDDYQLEFEPAIHLVDSAQDSPDETESPFQNVRAGPLTAGTPIRFSQPLGADKVYRENLAFHRDAFTLVVPDLPLPEGTDNAFRIKPPGEKFSIRCIKDYDIETDQFKIRFDMMLGCKTIDPRMAVRILVDEG